MTFSHFALAPLALACALACGAPPALAQSATPEVVVTGSARAQRVLDAPFAITAIDASALRDAGAMINLSEVMARVPGLVVNNRNNYAQDLQISSRGFGARAAFGVRGLRLYADGIPATMPDGQGQVAHFDLAGAQRIEVLRGPFSVLYGNASGGVIALFTAPATRTQAEVAVDAGSFGLRQGRFSVATPLAGGFDLRASYADTDVDGFRPQSAAHRTLGNLRLGWQGAADTVTLLVSDHGQRAQDPLGLTAAQFAADPRQTTPEATSFDTRKTIRQTQVGLNWRHDFGDAGALRESQLTVYQGARGVTQWQAITVAAQVSAKSGGGVVDFDRNYGGVEGRLTWRLGQTDVVAGVSVETLRDNRQGYENFTTPPLVLGVTGKLRRDEVNQATTTDGFVQARTPLAEGWDLTGGLRGGRVEMRTDDHFPTPFTAANPDDSGTLSYSYANPVLGLRWAPAPEWALHASAARGFESPTLGELAYSTGTAGGFNTSLKGQTSRQFELGAKWRSAALELDAALFHVDTADEIGVLSNTGGRSIYQNVGRTRREGAELSGLWRAAPGLRLQAALSVLRAEYLDSFQTCAVAGCPSAANPKVTVAAGNRISGTQKASGWAEAAWRPGTLLAGFPGELGLEWRALARTLANDTNSAAAAGYALANLRWSGSVPLGASDAVEVLARIDNLFDRAYVGSVIVNDGNQRFYEPGAPRSGLVSLRWQHRW
jgi:iron complex outermembrane receptor protein